MLPPMRHDTTDTTGHDATDTTRRDTTAEIVVDVATAAAALGVSAGAVRKRLERGHLTGHKEAGQWRVVLPADDATRHDATNATRQDTTRHDATGGAVTPAARSQLDAVRDGWLQPLVDQLRALERDYGRVEQERDQLRAELARLQVSRDPGTEQPPAPGPWQRLRRRLRGE